MKAEELKLSFLSECSEARREFANKMVMLTVEEHKDLKTKSDTLIILYDQMGNIMEEYAQLKVKEAISVSDFFDEELREKYFNECVSTRVVKSREGIPIDHHKWISYAPHDLFEWFKHNVSKLKDQH